MLKEIVCAGFGGQGILTAGKIILYVAYKSGAQVTWFPSYGNEMRGGSANCNIVISSDRIASPYADEPDILMALNELSVNKFRPAMKPGAQLFLNSSLIPADKALREDLTVLRAPVTE
ncbi:MAG: 2-oxoacid:acceptor oxidoreductase family protein, partial [Clostridia bacterium]